MARRDDIRFAAGDGHCSGWLYSAPRGSKLVTDAGAPCVVLAHGFGGTKEGRLDAFAECFIERGMAALVFDYRHFGDSSGQPRQLIDIGRQHEDWQAAIEKARSLEGIDAERIAIWGSSNSGGHVVWVAARDDRLKAVVAQVPHADGIATLRNLDPIRAAKLTAAGVQDRALSLIGRTRQMAIVGPPGSTAAMTGDDAGTLYPAMFPDEAPFRNETPARIMLTYGAYRPVGTRKRSAARSWSSSPTTTTSRRPIPPARSPPKRLRAGCSSSRAVISTSTPATCSSGR